MYSLAFTSNDISYIVEEALKTIPKQSTYYQCIADVIKWHKQFPNDWHQTWLQIQQKWSDDIACPDGVFNPFDIDAKINSAYVVLGLLYGNGDYTKTLEITTRAGQDADCNPSSAGGILGTVLGYNKIPAYWKMGLKEAEDIDFKYTTISLNKVYAIGFKHALANIACNGGKVTDDKVIIQVQTPATVALEQGFTGVYPISKKRVHSDDIKTLNFDFEGTGFTLKGEAFKKNNASADYVFQMEVYIDGQKTETVKLPTNFTTRRYDLCWKYSLPKQKHTVMLKILNPDDQYGVRSSECIVFSDKPVK
jgi:hypothetical protein